MTRDPYRELYLIPGAPEDVVEAAWRALVRLFHPDRAGPSSGARMAAINAAHDLIKSGVVVPPRSRQEPPSAAVRMPFGKHKDTPLREIPSDYFEWLLANVKDLRPAFRHDIETVIAWRRDA